MPERRYAHPQYEEAGGICEKIEEGGNPRKWGNEKLWHALATLCATQIWGGTGLFAPDYSPEVALIADELARRHGPPILLSA